VRNVRERKKLGWQGSEVSKGNNKMKENLLLQVTAEKVDTWQGLFLVARGDPVKHVNTLVTPKKG